MTKRIIDAKLRRVANSFVITVPMNVVNRFKLKNGDFIEVAFKPLK